MKSLFTFFTVRTHYDTLLAALYWSLLGNILLTLVCSVQFPAVVWLWAEGLSLPLLLAYRLRLYCFPPRHPRLIHSFLDACLAVSFGLTLFGVFRLSYSLSLLH